MAILVSLNVMAVLIMYMQIVIKNYEQYFLLKFLIEKICQSRKWSYKLKNRKWFKPALELFLNLALKFLTIYYLIEANRSFRIQEIDGKKSFIIP